QRFAAEAGQRRWPFGEFESNRFDAGPFGPRQDITRVDLWASKRKRRRGGSSERCGACQKMSSCQHHSVLPPRREATRRRAAGNHFAFAITWLGLSRLSDPSSLILRFKAATTASTARA